MARPQKRGLDYFPVDVSIMTDRKLRKVKLKYGMVGFQIYFALLCIIYSDKGYYISFNEKNQDNVVWEVLETLQGKTQPSSATVFEVIESLVKSELFDIELFKTEIITSKRIQSTYYSATTERSTIVIDFDIWLLSVDEMSLLSKKSVILKNLLAQSNNPVNQPNNSINQPNNSVNWSAGTQSKVKESKVNKSKVNKSKVNKSKVNESKVNTPITPKGDTSANVNQSESNETSEGESLTVETARGTADNPSVDHSMTLNARFSEFWNQYPKKTGKGAAEKAWERLHPTKEQHEIILQALSKAVVCDQWQRDNGQFIPNPLTWLNQRRWEDEYTPSKPQIKQEIYDNEVRLWK